MVGKTGDDKAVETKTNGGRANQATGGITVYLVARTAHRDRRMGIPKPKGEEGEAIKERAEDNRNRGGENTKPTFLFVVDQIYFPGSLGQEGGKSPEMGKL